MSLDALLSTCAAGLAPGDLILYHGTHPMHLLHERRTGCFWGQVGLILDLPPTGELGVFEATRLSECVDVRLGQVVRGVQIVRLSDRVRSFTGRIAFRQLDPALDPGERHALHAIAREWHGRPFNDDKWVGPNALRRRNPPSPQDRFFCSELVAGAYQRLGVMAGPPQGHEASNFVPGDFDSSYARSIVRLCNGRKLRPEWLLPQADDSPALLRSDTSA